MSEPRPTSPLWMRILLLASLAVNLLIVGLIVGAMLFGRGHGDGSERLRAARDLAPAPFVLAVEREDRRALVSELRERSAPYRRRDRAEVRAALEDLLHVLREEEFDAAAIQSLMEDERRRALGRQEAGQQVMLEYLSNLSDEERRAYADRLEEIVRRFGRRQN